MMHMRVTKRTWYGRGGFKNSAHFRRMRQGVDLLDRRFPRLFITP